MWSARATQSPTSRAPHHQHVRSSTRARFRTVSSSCSMAISQGASRALRMKTARAHPGRMPE
eukprot:6241341-Lingulodinium_polyedra.AAC.1